MHKIIHILSFQWLFLAIAIITIIIFQPTINITGHNVLITDETHDFAAPFDAYSGNNIITLTHQKVDNTTFHISADISMSNSYIYHNVYYYTTTGWKKHSISGSTWIKNTANTNIEDFYANIPAQEGDNFYLGVWLCKSYNNSWSCGCKNPLDCGYWNVQSIDLSAEGTTLIPCADVDGDGYGSTGETQCFFTSTDCDDTNAAVNPGEIEIPYNAQDDDCNSASLDDDLDTDGAAISSDCNDHNAGIHPLATETCDDTIDQDCNGLDDACEQCGEGAVITTGCMCADNTKYIGFCCDNTYQLDPCGTPEVIFYDGFESGTGNTWTYLNPYARVNKDLPLSGRFSLNFIYASGTLQSNQYAEINLVPYNHLYHRYFVYFEEDYLHEINGVALTTFGRTTFPIMQQARIWQGDTSQGKLFVSIDGEEFTTSTIFHNGQWYCIEEEIITSAGNDAVTIWIDSTLVFSKTGLDFSNGDTINYLKQGGKYSDTIDDTLHIYVDDIIVSRERVGCS